VIFLIFIFLFFLLIYEYNSKQKINFIYIYIGIILILFSGLRYMYGLDYNSYKGLYFSTNPSFSSIEFLFSKFMLVIKSLSNQNYYIFIFINAFIAILTKIFFIKKNTRYFFLSIFIYFTVIFLVYDLGLLRQSLAMGIISIGFLFDEKDKNISFIFYVIAVFVHITSIIILFVFLFYKIIPKFHYNNCLIIILLILAYLIGNFILPIYINDIMNKLINSEYLLWKINFYLNNYPNTGISLNLIRGFFIIFLILNSNIKNKFTIYYILGLIIYSFFSFNVQFATRFFSYFLIM